MANDGSHKHVLFTDENGKEQEAIVDTDQVVGNLNLLAEMFNPNKAIQFFQRAQVDGQNLYEITNIDFWLQYKQERAAREIELQILQQIGALKIRGLVFLFMRLKIIKLIREIFILDLKQGREMMIPAELRMDKLPESFKFYDPILSILQRDIDFFSKYAFNIRK